MGHIRTLVALEDIKTVANLQNKDYLDFLTNLSYLNCGDLKLIKEVFEPLYDVCVFVSISTYDEQESENYRNKAYINHCEFYINVNGTLLSPHRVAYNKKTFSLSLKDSFKSDATRYCEFKESKPNLIGKATTKKVEAWLDYLLRENEAKISYHNEKMNTVNAFLKTLEPYDDKIVWWNKEKTNGYFERGGLRYEFEIKNGYVSQNIRLVTYQHDLDTFLKLSDNKM